MNVTSTFDGQRAELAAKGMRWQTITIFAAVRIPLFPCGPRELND